MAGLMARLEREGYVALRAVVPREAVEQALRRLHRDVVEQGLPKATIRRWRRETLWFPHLRWEPEILALAEHLPAELREGEPAEPQIVVQLPDFEEYAVYPHVDRPPPWADGRPYRAIVGVALSRSAPPNGGLLVWPPGAERPAAVELETGDAVAMHPALPHTGGHHREGGIRYAVYFRYLERRAASRSRG